MNLCQSFQSNVFEVIGIRYLAKLFYLAYVLSSGIERDSEERKRKHKLECLRLCVDQKEKKKCNDA